MIEVTDLTKSFTNISAVGPVSFTAAEGENFILLGPSGCGKTTCLRMINRLIEPDSGKVLINGVNIKDSAPEKLRRKIGYVMQNHGLFSHYTVSENIAVVPELLGWDKKKIQKRTKELLEKLKLPVEKYWSAYPSELSGGQQQRVGLARALAADPDILLMDEAFGALDPLTRMHIRKEFMELDELSRKTIVMVTHDVLEAFQLGDRICLMEKGKILQTGSPSEILFKPASNYVKSFFDEHRLSLTMHLARLNYLLPFIKTEGITAETKNTFNDSDSLSDVFQTLSDPGNSDNEIGIITSGKIIKVPFESLMKAFQQWKIQKENE